MAAEELSRRRKDYYVDSAAMLPLEKLRVADLVWVADGVTGVKGKLKSIAIATVRDFLSVTAPVDRLMQSLLARLDTFPVMQNFAASRMASQAVSPTSHARPAAAGTVPRLPPGRPHPGMLGVPPPTLPAPPRHPLDAHATTFRAAAGRPPAAASWRSVLAAAPAAGTLHAPPHRPAVDMGRALRQAALACVPGSSAVAEFAFGPALATTTYSAVLSQASPTFDRLGRATKHLLVLTVLSADPGHAPLFRVPMDVRIALDGKPVRVPGPGVCAWDISKVTIRGRRAAPVTLAVSHGEPRARVMVAVVKAMGRVEDAVPVRAIRSGLAHPAAALLAMRASLTGALWSACQTPACAGASLRVAEAARARLGRAHSSATAEELWNGPAAASRLTQPAGDGDDDDDIGPVASSEALRVSDPLTLRPVAVPVRGADCPHLAVFDARTFEALAAAPGGARKCPHCRRPLAVSDLRVDTALAAVLAEVRGGVVSGTLAGTVSRAFLPSPEAGAIVGLALMGTEQAAEGAPPAPAFLNVEDGVAVDGGVVQSLRLSPSGSWTALGHDGMPLRGAGPLTPEGSGSRAPKRDRNGEGLEGLRRLQPRLAMDAPPAVAVLASPDREAVDEEGNDVIDLT